MRECWRSERRGLRSKASHTLCRFSGVRTVRGAPCFTANTLLISSNFFIQTNMVFRDDTRPRRPTFNCRLKTRCTCHTRFVITTNTGKTLLHVPTLHYNWPHEMASSPLTFPFPPTTTSYRVGAIFKFEMCQSTPRHPVYTTTKQTYVSVWQCIFHGNEVIQ